MTITKRRPALASLWFEISPSSSHISILSGFSLFRQSPSPPTLQVSNPFLPRYAWDTQCTYLYFTFHPWNFLSLQNIGAIRHYHRKQPNFLPLLLLSSKRTPFYIYSGFITANIDLLSKCILNWLRVLCLISITPSSMCTFSVPVTQ